MQPPRNESINDTTIAIACTMNVATQAAAMLEHIANDHADVVLSAGHVPQLLYDAADVLRAIVEYGRKEVPSDLFAAIALDSLPDDVIESLPRA